MKKEINMVIEFEREKKRVIEIFYLSFCRRERFFKETYIPDELLKPDLDVETAVHVPECPVLVFIDINNKNLGERLFDDFCYHLNKKQVIFPFPVKCCSLKEAT